MATVTFYAYGTCIWCHGKWFLLAKGTLNNIAVLHYRNRCTLRVTLAPDQREKRRKRKIEAKARSYKTTKEVGVQNAFTYTTFALAQGHAVV